MKVKVGDDIFPIKLTSFKLELLYFIYKLKIKGRLD
jgi:hypothetical protein